MEQRTPEWFAARKVRVTGSKVGAILGLSPYQTRDDVIRAMVREYHGAPSEFEGNIATEYGTRNEADAIAAFEMETGLDVEPAPFVSEEDWLGASPDGYVSDGGLIEVKCPFGLRDKKEPVFKTAKGQPHYYAQMQVQMYVTAKPSCHFWQWSPYGHAHEVVDYDAEWINENLPALRQFHAEYLSDLDNPDHLAPKRVGLNTEETRRLIEEYDDLKEAEDRAKERLKEVQARIIELAKDRDALVWGRKLTKVQSQGSVSYAKVVKDHCPDVDLEEYRGNPSVSWRLT